MQPRFRQFLLLMSRKTILIIDDEERIRELVQACLEELGGWATLTAASGQEGLEIASIQPIDAVLLDVSMPNIDGFTVYQQLQTNPITCSIPIIFLSARVQPSERTRFTNINIAGVITKPFDPLTISQNIAQILGWDD